MEIWREKGAVHCDECLSGVVGLAVQQRPVIGRSKTTDQTDLHRSDLQRLVKPPIRPTTPSKTTDASWGQRGQLGLYIKDIQTVGSKIQVKGAERPVFGRGEHAGIGLKRNHAPQPRKLNGTRTLSLLNGTRTLSLLNGTRTLSLLN